MEKEGLVKVKQSPQDGLGEKKIVLKKYVRLFGGIGIGMERLAIGLVRENLRTTYKSRDIPQTAENAFSQVLTPALIPKPHPPIKTAENAISRGSQAGAIPKFTEFSQH